MMPCQGGVFSYASSSQVCCPCTSESPDHKHLSIITSLLPLQYNSEEILHDTLPFNP
jgi:hypothetical protein